MLKLITRLSVVALVLAIIAGPFSVQVTYAQAVTPENTYELCHDGINNDADLNLLTDLSDPSCAGFLVQPVQQPQNITPENSYELCHDGINNDSDLNILTDMSDPSCAPYANAPVQHITPENTLELCTDGINNDSDLNLLTDMSDPNCAPFVNNNGTTTPPVDNGTTTPPDNGGGTSGGPSSASGNSATFTSSGPATSFSGLPATGTVLGASTGPEEGQACTYYSLAYMKRGINNDVNEVKKLQIFLNNFNNAGLPVTGQFDLATEDAVKALQTKYAAQILQPWVDAGLMNPIAATGYVFKTTQRFINMQMCPSLNIPAPLLK